MQFRVHDLVEVRFDESFGGELSALYELSDVSGVADRFPAASRNELPPAQLHVLRGPPPDQKHMREITPGLFWSDGRIWDAAYAVGLEFGEPGSVTLRAEHLPLEWYVCGLQLCLLSRGASLAHGAALEYEGRALFFPSWGGVGKTALVSTFVREPGWRLLGDDMAFITRDGRCLAYPKAFVLYPYHRPLFPDVFASGEGPRAPLLFHDSLERAVPLVKGVLRKFPAALYFARRHNPRSRRVCPSRIFGWEKIASAGTLDTIVWLDRVAGLAAPEMVPAEANLPSRVFGSTYVELDGHCTRCLGFAVGCGEIPARLLFSDWQDVLERGFSRAKRFVLRIPADLPVQEVPSAVKQCLDLEQLGAHTS